LDVEKPKYKTQMQVFRIHHKIVELEIQCEKFKKSHGVIGLRQTLFLNLQMPLHGVVQYEDH
jgi:hypothetical protein